MALFLVKVRDGSAVCRRITAPYFNVDCFCVDGDTVYYAGADEISFGIYACSPEESSFTAVFSDMKITECAWKAHDGQQPDKK